MKRRLGAVVGVAIVVALIAMLWVRRDGAPTSTAPGHAVDRGAGAAMTSRPAQSDPRTLPRGSISGTVTDEAKAPIARAQVCTNAVGSELPSAITRMLKCVFTDDHGHYRIGDLIGADYLLHASAREFRPGAFHPTPGANNHKFPLAAGEAKTGVDVELKRGGAEITGVVVDVSGGPIVHAEIREATRGSEHAGAAVESDERGRFSLWIDRGNVTVDVTADGYIPAQASGRAPGKLEILLMPESSLAGTVVDAATEQPVAGVHVELEVDASEGDPDARDITDAQGKFRLEHLSPGRYTVAARGDHGYGRSTGSLLVGLGQQVDGAVIKLFPAHRVVGRVVIAGSHKDCADTYVQLRDAARDRAVELRAQPDGRRVADGVVPGTYSAAVQCPGYLTREYEPVVVGDRDVTGVVWEVDEGARIRGKVLSKSGAALDGVALRAERVTEAGGRPGFGSARSKTDGSFELAGLQAGTHRITVTSDRGVAPPEGFEVTVAPAATLEHDLVLDDSGKVIGSVVDDTGAGAPDVRLFIVSGDPWNDSATSDSDGAFVFEALRPGEHRMFAYRDRPGAITDRKETKVTVRAGQTATVKLVVESLRGTITGTVVDAANQPVQDAFLSWARERGRAGAPRADVASTREDWHTDVRPVLTAADGGFQLTRLAEGTYTLRAYRKGGGEAIAEHVAIGATTRLQIKPTGSLSGAARREGGSPPQDLKVMLEDPTTHFKRSEWFYMTGGRFAVTDLPAGHFDIVVEGDGRQKAVSVDLREGEAKTGIDVELTPQVTVTGRLVEHGTQKPVRGYYMVARPSRGPGATNIIMLGDETENVSDEAGRFTLRRVPVGEVVLHGSPRGMSSRDRGMVDATRTISGTGTVDIGDVGVLRARVKSGDPIGVLGLQYEAPSDDLSFEQRELKIKAIDPAGPAAGTGLQVGDVITTCDGVDVTGRGLMHWWTLATAPPGAKLTLGTRRGVTVTIVLGPGGSVMR